MKFKYYSRKTVNHYFKFKKRIPAFDKLWSEKKTWRKRKSENWLRVRTKMVLVLSACLRTAVRPAMRRKLWSVCLNAYSGATPGALPSTPRPSEGNPSVIVNFAIFRRGSFSATKKMWY